MKKVLLNLVFSVFLFASIWDGSSNSSTATKTTAPYYTCGIFKGPLITFDTIQGNGTNPRVCGSKYLYAVKVNNLDTLKCSISQNCDNATECSVKNPPVNKYNPSLLESEGTTNIPDDLNFTGKDYVDNKFTNNDLILNFNPQTSYSDSSTKYSTFGAWTFDDNNVTLNFKPGDYYFHSLEFDGKNVKINILDGGPVRIFVEENLQFYKNNVYINDNGDENNLFIYVGGNMEFKDTESTPLYVYAFSYVKGNVEFKSSSDDFYWYGGITAEGDITIDSDSAHFIYRGTTEKLGYQNCPLCYAYNNGSRFLSFEAFNSGINFQFPRIMSIINNSGRTLNDVNVSQIETNPAWIHMGSPENYSIVDEKDNIVNNNITNTITYSTSIASFSQSKSGVGTVTRWAPSADLGSVLNTELNTTAEFGDYNSGGYNQYMSIKTYKISGQFNGNENLNFFADYLDNGKIYKNIKLDYCQIPTTNGNYTGIKGPFGAWDTFRNINDRNISTKIVNQEFNLTLASLNEQDNALQLDKIGDVNVSIYDMTNKERISNIAYFDTNNSDEVNKTFTVFKASRKARVEFLLCSNYNSSTKIHTLYNYSHCSGSIVDCNISGLHFRRCYSSDDFAIRPYAFLVFGQNQYKRAGEDFNVTIKAVDKINYDKNSGVMSDIKGVSGYNENLNNLNISAIFYTPTNSEIKQMNDDINFKKDDTNISRVAYCPNPGNFSIVNGNEFINGEINATMNYSESGVLTLKVAEINGSEFAKVDEKDTNDSQRLIKPATFIINENNLSQKNLLLEFIPYKFVTNGLYNSTTGGFIYMNNINNTIIPKMAAFLEYDITAENKGGQKLLNYTKTCFPDTSNNAPTRNGLKLNTTFDLFLDADMNVSDEANLSFSNIDTNNNSHIWLLHPKLNLTKGAHHIQQWISPLDFNEGKGSVKLFFNIKKDYRHPENEVNITIKDINTSTSWMSNPGATKIFIGKNNFNKNAIFRYGRIDVQNVAGYGDELNTTYQYEYWTKKGWVVNKEHNSSIFGDVNGSNSYHPFITMDINHTIKNGLENVTLSTTHALPYSTKIHLAISSWLWYHPLAENYKAPSSTNLNCLTHPCESVTFNKTASGWGGIGKENVKSSETNRTAEINASFKKIKANKAEVKKLNW